MSRFGLVDGGVVTLESDVSKLDEPWNSTFEVRVRTRSVGIGDPIDELEVYRAGNHLPVIEHELNGTVAETVTHKGGLLVVAHGVEQGLLAWVGERHEIAVFTRNPRPTLREAMRRFHLFTIAQTDDGLSVTSQDPDYTITPYCARKPVRGLGMIIIKSPREAIKLMPSWRGQRVPVGEVWRIDGSVPADDQVLVGSPTCAAVLSPTAGVGFDELLDFSARMRRLDWRN